MRKIGFFIALLVFTVMSESRVLAYQTVCDPNSRWCTSSYAYKCNSTGTSYSRTYCSAGCSGSYCRCTSVSYSSWGSCYCSGSTCTQTRTIISKTPSGCSGTAALSRSCCTTSSYPTSCKSGVLYTCSQSQPNSITCTYGSCKSGTECASCNSTSGCGSGYTCVNGSCKPTCTSFVYGDWGACDSANLQHRSVTSSSPSGCTGGIPVTTQACNSAQICTSFTYNDWSSCSSGGVQTRTVKSSSPSGCTGGSPVTSRSCTPDCSTVGGFCTYDISGCTSSGGTSHDGWNCGGGQVCCTGVSAGNLYYYYNSSTNSCLSTHVYSSLSTCATAKGTTCYSSLSTCESSHVGCKRTEGTTTTTFPIGTVKCGDGSASLPDDNKLYTCTPSGWVGQTSSCAEQNGNILNAGCLLGGTGCKCTNPSLYANSGCSDDHLCTDQGGNCQFMVGAAGTECTIITNGQPGIIKSNLCLSDKYFTYGSCCVPVDSNDGSCNGKWPGSTCVTAALCPTESGLQYGTVSGCSSGSVCCGRQDSIICDDSGFNGCGSCGECVNPGMVQSYCKSTRTTGSSGAVGSANGSKMDSISTSTSGLCSSSYGVVITDSSGSDGTFNWTCEGQAASGCRSAGNNAYGSANTCTNKPVVNGACNSNITGLSATELCHSGTPVYSASDTNHDYINDSDETEYVWGCQGSRNTCSEGDGADQLNCSSTMVQEPWFQVNDGNILSKGKVTNYVPRTTCSGNGSGCGTTVKNGAIYSKLQSSVSSYDSAVESDSSDFNFKTYTFNQLKASYFDSNGVGTTFSDNPKWSEVKNTTGVIFVDGDLEINENLVTTNFVMIIAKGTITIDYNVNEFDGILVADKVVAAAADESVIENVSQLVIKGMIHGVNGVEFSRSLVPNDLNNTSPSVVVDYNPELLFKVPVELSKAFSQWKIN